MDGYMSSVWLCNHLHKHKGALGIVIRGKPLEFASEKTCQMVRSGRTAMDRQQVEITIQSVEVSPSSINTRLIHDVMLRTAS